MAYSTINPKLVPLALEHVDTTDFERFAQNFYAAIIGRAFVPLGGVHDGGAEGYLDPELFEDDKARHFLQVSKQKTHRAKIRNTVNRLRQYGRDPASLDYVTSIVIADLDNEEETLSDELHCRIRIRDGKYIETQINRNSETVAAFESYLSPHLSYLGNPGAANLAPRTQAYVDRTLAVFLRQEVEHRRGKTDLLESVADSLIIWALTDTDPDQGRLMGRAEILERIEKALPSARQFIRGVLDTRLKILRERTSAEDRKVRFYTKDKKYCLPYETRKLVVAENIEDESLRVSVNEIFERRCRDSLEEGEEAYVDNVVMVCFEALQILFEHQGLQVAQFVTNNEQDDELYANVAIYIVESIEAHPELVGDLEPIRRLSTKVLRGTFYSSTETERSYLEKLSKTYVLMLTLRNEPKVVEYFKTLSSHFTLYIGTDFLVQALSEHFLDQDNQITRNLFAILKVAGATLVLTERAVKELATHIRAQIFEFEAVYAHVESRLNADLVEYVDRILIKSYFYARLSPIPGINAPAGFRSYIENFGSYSDIKAERGDKELAHYLIAKFGFHYETAEEMQEGVDMAEVDALAKVIKGARVDQNRKGDAAEVLAANDALQVFAIYAKRLKHREGSPANPFGFKTWWLTQDGKVRKAAATVVAQRGGRQFMIRPEFLTNFISFAPSAAQVSASYKTVFPSVLGIKLSNRVANHTFRDVVRKANEVWSVDEDRAGAIIASLTEKLKGDTMKIYDVKY